jgi:quercetin dioxygenase-like cupin family protein
MDIKRTGSHPSKLASPEYFMGRAWINPVAEGPAPARIRAVNVTFEPGARTAWHSHPLGQALLITSGTGLVQKEGGMVEQVYPGDTIWFAPGEKHWHGAAADSLMSHIAIQESLDGQTVEWFELVSDAQYQGL